jgi:pentatricopeptide repeat protein
MKKQLNQLNRRFHKNREPLQDLIPEIRIVLEIIQKETPKDTCQCLNMIINIVTSDIKFTEEIFRWAQGNGYLTEQIYTGIIKSLAEHGDIDQAIHYLGEMSCSSISPHIRTLIPIYKSNNIDHNTYLSLLHLIRRNNITPNQELFSLLLSTIPKDSLSIYRQMILWSSQHYNHLLPIVQNSSVLISKTIAKVSEGGSCNHCETPIGILDLDDHQRDRMIGSVFDANIKHGIMRWVQTRHYDIVIDGANVAHYNNSPFDLRKVINMVNRINKRYNKKILIVFSQCRKKATKNLVGKWDNVDVFYTQIGTNDDLSWLYVGLYYPDIWCITNDQMRDHVYHRFT